MQFVRSEPCRNLCCMECIDKYTLMSYLPAGIPLLQLVPAVSKLAASNLINTVIVHTAVMHLLMSLSFA